MSGLDNNVSLAMTQEDGMSSLISTMLQEASSIDLTQQDLGNRTDLDSIVHVNKEYPFKYAQMMFGYFMPFILIITLITNSLVVAVLYQPHMRTPTNIVLLCMALVDLATLLFPSPWYFLIYTIDYYHDKFLHPPSLCYVHHVMTDSIPIIFHTASIWLALLLASQRYIYVCHPTLARTWCTVPRVRKAISMIMSIAVLHQFSRFFDYDFVTVELPTILGGAQSACRMDVASWVQYIGGSSYYTMYFGFRILFVYIIPCVALIVLNCLLLRALRRAENKRTELLNSKFKQFGGERGSVTTGGPYIANKMNFNKDSCRSIIPRRLGGSIVANGRTTSEFMAHDSLARNLGFANQKMQKAGRFCVFFSKQKEKIRERKPSQENIIKISFSANQTNDTKSSCSTIDELSANNNRQDGCNQTIQSRERKITSEDTSDSYSDTTTNQKDHNPNCLSKSSVARKSGDKHYEDKEIFHQRSSKDEEEDEVDGDEDDFTCLECATSCQDGDEIECQRCLASANGGATGGRTDHSHQAVSQCSSLLGGATNEDVSSCAITQDASTSIYVVHDGTLDAIETESIREEDDMDRESRRLVGRNRARLEGNAQSMDIDETRRSKKHSAKFKRQLTCGCGSPIGRQMYFHRVRSTASHRDHECKECCIANECGSSTRSNINHSNLNNDSSRGDTSGCEVAACSRSDPCMNCTDSNTNNRDNTTTKSTPDTVDERHVKSTLPTSDSSLDYDESNKMLLKTDILASSSHALPTTTTTVPTISNPHSTNSDSNGSLPRTTQNQASALDRRASNQLDRPTPRQLKSPSVASCTGRGSRATLMSVPNQPTPSGAISNAAMGTTASSRFMDSHRTTLMLIVVVTVFLLVEVPVAVTTILHVVINTVDFPGSAQWVSTLSYVKLFTNFFILVSYSVNFSIYCSMSRKFRETFTDLFLSGFLKEKNQAPGLAQQRDHHPQLSQYNQHHFNEHDNQLVSSNNATVGFEQNHNDFATTVSGPNHNAGMMRTSSPFKRAGSQQQECEL